MKQFPLRIFAYFAIDCAILAVALLHIPSLIQRATPPFEIEKKSDQPVVSRVVDSTAVGGMKKGDIVLRWKGEAIPMPEAVELLCDFSSIGDSVVVAYRRDGNIRETTIKLIPYYPSLRFIIITFFVGIVIWGTGIYILWNGWKDLAGRVLHWAIISFAADIMLTWGAVFPTFVEKVLRPYMFFGCYEVGVAFFFLFTTLYPKPKPGSRVLTAIVVFTPALSLLAASLYFYLNAVRFNSIDYFIHFQSVYDIFHVVLFVYIGGGIFNLIHSQITASTPEERQRTTWMLWGFAVGAIPFLFLYILPQLLLSGYLIDEEYATIFFLMIPLAFAISFLKYRLLDIDVVINRSIVYSVLTIFIAAAYILTVLLFTSLIGGEIVFEQYLYVVGITLAVAAVFNPLRKRIQRLVDESLFAARSNFHTAMAAATERLHSVLSSEELFITVTDAVKNIVPSETIAVYRVKKNVLALEASLGPIPPHYIPLTKEIAAALESSSMLALKESLLHIPESADLVHTSFFKEHGFVVCAPIRTQSAALIGMLALRPRTMSEKYDENEIDFIVTLCSQAAGVLDRLLLQERIILERDEKRRLEELSNLKSDFVSYVSHELRTPLTSVKMFSELLQPRLRPHDAKAKEYIATIDDESERLSRMVTNILDAARIDKGLKVYTFADVDFCDAVRNVMETMKYQLRKNRFTVEMKIPKRIVMIHADVDAVQQAVGNLVTNAIKYSAKGKKITVEVVGKKSAALCRVTDRGDGVAQDVLPRLFEKFYRAPTYSGTVQGVGLGLPLVKHIMDAHGGRIDVDSIPGKGSSFTVVFPRIEGGKTRRPRSSDGYRLGHRTDKRKK